jgi:hypothetical protein
LGPFPSHDVLHWPQFEMRSFLKRSTRGNVRTRTNQ